MIMNDQVRWIRVNSKKMRHAFTGKNPISVCGTVLLEGKQSMFGNKQCGTCITILDQYHTTETLNRFLLERDIIDPEQVGRFK